MPILDKTGLDTELLEQYRQELERSGKYKILEKLSYIPKTDLDPGIEISKLHYGIIVDIECTGLDHSADEIFNIGIAKFCYDNAGVIQGHNIGANQYREPAVPISKFISKMTRINPELLKGKSFNDEIINGLLAASDIVVAHNAEFVRPFVDIRYEASRSKIWLETKSQVEWNDYGLFDLRLIDLAHFFGFTFEAHRAIMKSLAILRIISQSPQGALKSQSILQMMLDRSKIPDVRIDAWESPFEKRDLLKNNGYFWNSRRKVWTKSIPCYKYEKEDAFMREQIYYGEPNHEFTEITETERFKAI